MWPPDESGCFGTSLCTGSRSVLRNHQRNTRYVTAVDTNAGSANAASQWARGGIAPANTTRFAGLEIGRKKDAAFATMAHAKR